MSPGYLASALLDGIRVTLGLAGFAFVGGVTLGLVFGLCRLSRWRALRWPATAYIEFFRTTPLLAQLVWLFVALPAMTGMYLTAFWSGAVTLALNQGAFKAEMFRSGIQEVERTQRDAAKVLGLSRFTTFRHVVAPQALAIIFPPFIASAMSLVKGTAYVGVIGVQDLTRTGQFIAIESLLFLPVLSGIAALYFVMIYPMGWLGRAIEHRTSDRWRKDLLLS